MAARDKQRGKKQVEEPGSFGRWAWEWTKSIAVAFVLFLVVRTFVSRRSRFRRDRWRIRFSLAIFCS